jgi:hypothetical protein
MLDLALVGKSDAGAGHGLRVRTRPPHTRRRLPVALIVLHLGPDEVVAAGGLNAGPYFQVAGSNGPWLTASGGATAFELLSVPAGAARGNFVFPASGLLAYGSAVAGFCVCGAGVCAASVANPRAVQTTSAVKRCLTTILLVWGAAASRPAHHDLTCRGRAQAIRGPRAASRSNERRLF